VDASEGSDFFAGESWFAIKRCLDSTPVFCVANEQGSPLQYEVNEKPMAQFFIDVEAAQAELKEAKAGIADGSAADLLDIIPVPLGLAYQLWCDNKALLVPSRAAIAAAGSPPDADPVGQQVPLFACMSISQQREEDGKPCLPLFLDCEEAKAAMASAMALDGAPGEGEDPFEISCLSLQKAVQLLATVPETPAFKFVSPILSLEFIKDRLA
jgi:hypothetical protein